jgi:gliding motility-associated-like protein
MKIIYTLFILLLLHVNASGQYYLQPSGSAAIDVGLGITTTANGEAYVSGYFSGAAMFGSINLTTSGLADAYIAKLDTAGKYIWAQGFGGTGVDKGITITHNNTGELYVAGTFENTITIGSTTLQSSGMSDIFILKISTSGTFLWATKAGGPSNDVVSAIAVDGNDDVVLTGYFSDTATFGNTTLISTLNPANGNPSVDLFISKLDNNGSFIWSKQGIATADDRGFDIATDTNAAIYLIAQFSDTITFNNTHPNNVNNAICIVKFDAAGNEIWFRKIIAGSTIPAALTVDAANHILVSGNFTGTLNVFTTPVNSLTPLYTNGIFVAQFSDTGSINWLKSNSSDNYLRTTDIVTGSNNYVYVMGEYKCVMTEFSSTYGSGIFNSVGYSDILLTAFDVNGNWQWARCYGGPKEDAAKSMSIDATNEMYFTGSFEEKFTAPLSKPSACFITATVVPYCNDSDYNAYCTAYITNPLLGNRDVITAKCFDLSRQPYDFYARKDTVCDRSILPACIKKQPITALCVDTITFCGSGSTALFAVNNINSNIGPKYNYLWSNGITNNAIQATPGTYIVTVTSADGCFSQSKQVFLNAVAPPVKALISDSKGINTNVLFPQKINFCAPDSVKIWASNIVPGFPHYWLKNGIAIYSDTVTVYQTGLVKFVVGDTNLCAVFSLVQVNVSQPVSGNYIIHVNDVVNQFDTIGSCLNTIKVSFIDSLTGGCFADSVFWTINPPCPSIGIALPCNSLATNNFYPASTGTYTISCYGLNSVCNGDTIGPVAIQVYYKSFSVPATPVLNITGAQDLCLTGDTITLSCSPSSNYLWTGPGIVSNNSLQSVQINLPGSYLVQTNVTSVDGCVASGGAAVQINYKPNPQIYITPSDGVICPSDSVLFYCPGAGNFQWIGPSGNFAIDSAIVYASQPGNYYCIVTDTSGCQLLSNSIAIENYSSPTLLVTPPIICNGSAALLQVVISGGAWQWQPPLSGNNAFQIIDSAGVYECAVLSCNIFTMLSATITEPVFPTTIATAGSTTICYGDSVMLTAPAGYSYHWLPNADSTQTIFAKDSGYYFVQLTDSMGCFDFTDSVLVQLVAPPLQPVIFSNAPLCEGNDLSLSSSLVTGLQYSWNGPSGFTSTLNNPVVTNVTVANAGKYYLNILNGGCSSDSAAISISVLPKPASPLITSNSPMCTGDSLQLTANASSLQTFSWLGPDGFSSTLQNPVLSNVTTAQSGLYGVIGYDGNCFSDTAFITISVLATPAAPVATFNSPLCTGDSLQLSASSVALQSYLWIGPDGFSSTLQNPVITNVTATQNGLYSVIGYDGNCFSDTTFLSISALAVPPDPIISANSPLCEGSTLQFTTPASAVSFSWSGPAGFTSTLQNPVLSNMQLNNAGTYNLIVSNGNCFSDTVTYVVAVTAIPLQPIASAVDTACAGSMVQLQAVASTLVNYVWYGPAGFSSTQQNPVLANAQLSNSGYYFVYTVTGLCNSLPDSTLITIVSLPQSPIITGATSVCENDSLILYTAIANTYQWTGPGGYSSTQQQVVIYPAATANSGNYNLVISTGNCQSAVTTYPVTVNTLPSEPEIIANSPLCEGDVLQLSVINPNALTYNWSGPNGFTATVTNPNITNASLSDSGIYMVTSFNGCESEPALVDVEINLCEIIIPNIFTPNNDGLNDYFIVESAAITNINYKIVDRWGVVVYSGSGATIKWNGNLNGNGKEVPSGTYFYIFNVTFKGATEKIINGYLELLR